MSTLSDMNFLLYTVTPGTVLASRQERYALADRYCYTQRYFCPTELWAMACNNIRPMIYVGTIAIVDFKAILEI